MLEEQGIPYLYREYFKDPLSEAEIRSVLRKLGMTPRQALRKWDKAYRELRLTGHEEDEVIVGHMATHPGLLNRPIVVKGNRAIIARPVEKILGFLKS